MSALSQERCLRLSWHSHWRGRCRNGKYLVHTRVRYTGGMVSMALNQQSNFYFGKHPSVLSLAESVMLAGMIPAPELRSPLRDSSRGKIFQARVLKRMVEVGFIDVETALLILKQPLHLRVDGLRNADRLLYVVSFSRKGLEGLNELKHRDTDSIMKDIWDWEKESKIWEVCEDMEIWATHAGRKLLHACKDH
ncbi:penicillin-binding protein 1A-like [Melia azedarach]|uniref:Penicillin-binding protein 1A-like n=1 Tax=Melia azedarach TaxID=155640 RepID=A0ACC1WNX1_MELAZ|nr:penicillin-binding protein 1A-like [Melia azedarach]